ncbi:cwf21 domain-containing protein [Coprinopsis sp. MPI-PUGE-AT-0042]|nr:cwf21 domain-containing protein [Coprinopsis sp. MPI-PUGE-AT-0042]
MYNGIGLTTPRGSGTSGYVQRNLSALRSYQRDQQDHSSWDAAPPKHREPDQGILDHERKRAVEVKCMELQDKLEEAGVGEEEIEKQVSILREKLLENLNSTFKNPRQLKPSDTHAIAAAKKVELERMARALGTRSDYQEGDSFDREKQEEMRLKRIAEREDKEKRRLEDRKNMDEQRKKRRSPSGSRSPRSRSRSSSRSRSLPRSPARRYRRSGSPPPSAARKPRSPLPTPAYTRDEGPRGAGGRDYRDREVPPHLRRGSPPPRSGGDARPLGRGRDKSPPPRRGSPGRGRTPEKKDRSRSRGRSASTGSSMSVSTRSGSPE